MRHPPITLALTHFNRFDLLVECVAGVLGDARIGEVVVSDDCSTDGSYERLVKFYEGHPKVKCHRNDTNLDCHYNKQKAVRHSTSEWVILFDSDNILSTAYLDTLFALPEWDPGVVYCPEFAEPHFNYTFWSGKVIDRSNVAELIRAGDAIDEGQPPYIRRRDRERLGIKNKDIKLPKITTALNTCNYFINRQTYLECWDGVVNPHTADSIYVAYRILRSNRKMMIVPGLRYFHRVHDGSHYKHNWRKTGRFHIEIEQRLRRLTAETAI